ncbi:CocE/NonD family hydrolase [Panacibacter sp. DH6]|uniref:CocE/NonD family hydrolase n=1 Tax=Panacibacter microcysteis TaxID=2793269 RepID=A0A931E3J9_9BACT|nr:CocE/NonD family hydrolase [Panacibacter microcysteis]MBG9374916.1 CocE/NonD family hydrolase [Panacibacter microcysteis]
MKALRFLVILSFTVHISCAQAPKDSYTKIEQMIPMRDGTRLYTAIYIPKNNAGKLPFLMVRTPYSCQPYGKDNLPSRLGPNMLFKNEPYIFVYQDVRGRHMSEGVFREMTPYIPGKKTNKDVDESSDTYDTVDWLLKNIDNNNGKVGIYGISYPGFYATAALPNAHPAIKAVSPQAPVTDEFEGDDAYHRGAFFVMDNFDFMNFFDAPRSAPRADNPPIDKNLEIKDAYDFYLKAGALSNLNTKYFGGKSNIWNEYLAHATKDAYWQSRDIRKHLVNVKPATLVVGGWFDAEDLFGALNTYSTIESQNKSNDNRLVMGPWTHGAWERQNWNRFVSYNFESNTAAYFQQMELDFFNYHLKAKGNFDAGEATIFFTGTNEWKRFAQWPPAGVKTRKLLLNANHQLELNDVATTGADEYVSDPANPVPYINKIAGERLSEYMAANQQFAAVRNDVLCYTSVVLDKDITLAGPLTANLSVSITGTDADFIVKIIDVLPDSAATQQLVRAEVLRGKFRNSFKKPEPFKPGKITPVKLQLNDVAHTFKKGHQIMVQVQSSWFPLVDRNPQQFLNIPAAKDTDFKKQSIKILHSSQYPSWISCTELE